MVVNKRPASANNLPVTQLPIGRIEVRLKTDELRTPSGRIIRLKPLVEGMSDSIINVPTRVSDKMGIEMRVPVINLTFFDDVGYNKAVEVRHGISSSKDNGEGMFFPEQKDIFVNAEKALIKSERTLKAWQAKIKAWEADGDSRLLDLLLHLNIVEIIVHEMAHLNHALYDAAMFGRITSWNNNQNRGFLKTIKVMIDRILTEGIASWTTSKISKDIYCNSKNIFEVSDSGRLVGKQLSLKEKLEAFFDPHSMGNWFVDNVEKLTGANPIKLIVDNVPKSVRELFNPEKYVNRLKKEGKMECET